MAGFKPGPFQCYYPSQRRLLGKNSNVAEEVYHEIRKKRFVCITLFNRSSDTLPSRENTFSAISRAQRILSAANNKVCDATDSVMYQKGS